MDIKNPVLAAGDDCLTLGAEEDYIEHSEEVVTSDSNLPEVNVVLTQPSVPVHQQQQQQQHIASAWAPPPVTQVVTLHMQPQPPQPVALTNSLRNIRLIAIQPKSPFNGLPISNGTTSPVASRPEESHKKCVGSFYSRTQPAAPRTQGLTAVRPGTKPPAAAAAAADKPTAAVKPSPSYYKEQQRQQELLGMTLN